jgi:hypothetical protein
MLPLFAVNFTFCDRFTRNRPGRLPVSAPSATATLPAEPRWRTSRCRRSRGAGHPDPGGPTEEAGPRVSCRRRRCQTGRPAPAGPDGLIEDRRRDIDEGLSALAATLRQSDARTADRIRAIATSMLDGEQARADDVCLLAARLPPETSGGDR